MLHAIAALLLAGTGSEAREAPQAPPPRVRLAVIVSVDGLSFDRLVYYRPWYVGGLKRLLDEAQVEAEARYKHLNTETGPGHSSLSTGAPPRITGIVANRWFEQGKDGSVRAVNCVDRPAPDLPPGSPPMFFREIRKDGRVLVFANAASLEEWEGSGEMGRSLIRPGYGRGGETVVFDSDDAVALFNMNEGRPKEPFPSTRTAPGPGNLRVPTVGDRLLEMKPGARVISISAKDRSAILLAGRDERHAAYWYDQDAGRFVTSPFYRPPSSAKGIVDGYNRTQAGPLLPARFGLAWKPLPPPASSAQADSWPRPMPNLIDYQIPSNGLGWDHTLTLNPRGYFSSLYYSPFTDDLVADLALAFVDDEAFGLGRRRAPDLLQLSFSAQDVVSHSYGTESEENLDVLRRLDLHLGRLLTALDRRLGREAVVLALSADHGFPLIPEAERQRNPSFRGGRLLSSDRAYPNFIERLNDLLASELCLEPQGRVIFGADGFNLIYNRPAFPFRTRAGSCGPADREVASADVDRVLPAVMTRFFGPEVESVYLVSQRDRWPSDSPVTEFVKNDFDPERSGDAFFIPRYGVMTHWDPARGAMHGTHFDYDTHVPLLFWGGPFRAGTRTELSTPYDVAPTLAAILGLSLEDAVGSSRAPR